MPKKIEKKSALDMVGWIEKLPEQGGTWGKGIIDTVMAFEAEAGATDTEVDKLEAQVKALKDKAAQRRSMALQAARRAEREATKLYDAAIIAKVKPAEQPSEPANGAKSATPS
jgi:hypothetical protein